MSEAKSVSGFKPRSQATIVETLWALAEAGAMLSMDPKISKPVLKKLTSRKNCGVKYSIPIKSINRSNSHDSPSKRLPWGRGRAKNRSPPRFGPVFDSFCLVSQFEASWLYILEFETLRTLRLFIGNKVCLKGTMALVAVADMEGVASLIPSETCWYCGWILLSLLLVAVLFGFRWTLIAAIIA